MFPSFESMTQPFSLFSDTFCGENKHLTTYLTTWSNVIGIWYNESKYFTHGEWPSEDDDITIDHYTQVTCGVTNTHIG